MQRFRGGLVFKAHRLCVSLNSRLESNKEEETFQPGARLLNWGERRGRARGAKARDDMRDAAAVGAKGRKRCASSRTASTLQSREKLNQFSNLIRFWR